MSIFVYVLTYLCIIVFAAAVIRRIINYIKKPLHLRWELYPVAHEKGRVSYGGGYLEEIDWWNKKREKSMIGELKVMIPEILLLKAVWENNRALWYVTYPFHLGLYCIVAFIGLLIIGALAALAGVPIAPQSAFGSMIAALTNFFGPAGFVLGISGAVGLLYKRWTDPGLRNYASFEHYFNLVLFIACLGLAVLTWLFVDPGFGMARAFVGNLITFHFAPITSGLFAIQTILAVLVIAYIPNTHMAHFFMKYFLYHDIRWGDEPNIDRPDIDKKIGIVLNYPVTWAAPHIAGHGRSTWAEVATFNPAAEPEDKDNKKE